MDAAKVTKVLHAFILIRILPPWQIIFCIMYFIVYQRGPKMHSPIGNVLNFECTNLSNIPQYKGVKCYCVG